MKKFLSLVMVLACVGMVAMAGNRKQKKADADTESFRYELESVETAGSGYVNVKVWSYSRRPSIAIEQCKKNAVHGILFKGSTGTGGTHRPLVKDPAAQSDHAEFFTAFFAEDGDYMRYVTNAIGTPETTKIGKEYKIAVYVKVNEGELRRHLEKANIIRSLNSGF